MNDLQSRNLEEHKARMRELAADFARRHPARDTLGLAEGLGAKLVFMDLGERDGAYDPEHHVILINQTHALQRQRFTLAHEVSHALLLGDDDLLSDLHDTFEGDTLEQVIETLCNVGAATILISDELLLGAIERHGVSGHAIADLARRAEVSVATALYALADHVRTPAVFAVAAPAGKALAISISAQTASMRYSLSPGTPIPDGHPVDTAWRTGLPIEEASFFPFRSGKRMPAYVSAYPQGKRVLCAFEERV